MALRTPLSVTPHLYMGDSTGRPLDKGVVYFGQQDKDPEFYPITLYSDDALTLPLAQPVHTKGGYLYDKGDMVEPHAKEIIYSVKVLDSYGRKVFYKGAMMRNSWNDDVIERIKEGIFDAQESVAASAADAIRAAIDGVAIDANLVTDALIKTLPVEGGVVRTQRDINSDRVSVKDFGAVGNGLTEDTIAVQKAIDYIASKGGGVVYFPAGDYPIMVSVSTPNIKFQGESINTTTIRAANTATMVRVHTTAPYFKLDNIKLTAQTIFNESQVPYRYNTKALHCIHLNGYKPTLSNFSTRGGRYDGVYVDYDGEIDATFTDFFMDTSARNPLSVISGSKLTFQNGRIYIDNTCHSNEGEAGSIDLAGLYIVDFEPDYIGHKYDNILFDNVLFESNGTSPDNWQIKFEDTNIGDVNDLRLTMRDCEFRNTGGATATPSICLYNRRGGRYFKGVTIDGLRTSGRLMTISDDTLQYIQSSTFNNITLTNIGSLGYGVIFGAGCVLSNIKHIAGTPISIQKSAGVTLKNFGGYPDTNGARCVEDTLTGMLKVEAVRYLSLGGTKEFSLGIPQNSSGTLKFRSAQTTANTQNNTIVDVHFFTGNVAVDHAVVDHRKEVTPPLTVSPTAPNEKNIKVKSVLARNLLVSLECFVSDESKAKDIISRFNSATLVTP